MASTIRAARFVITEKADTGTPTSARCRIAGARRQLSGLRLAASLVDRLVEPRHLRFQQILAYFLLPRLRSFRRARVPLVPASLEQVLGLEWGVDGSHHD